MSAASAIAALRQAGIRTGVVAGKLRLVAPPTVIARVVTPEVRQDLIADATGVLDALREDVLAILEHAVAEENDRHRRWRAAVEKRGVSANVGSWLREVAPDLRERIHAAEDEIDVAVLAVNETALRAALGSWRHRWSTARIGFEYFAGLRDDDDG